MKENAITTTALLLLIAAMRAEPSWGQIGFGPGESMEPSKALEEARADKPGVPIEWVSIDAGKFMMGTGRGDAKPIREVSLKAFALSKTLVTVEQYEECVDQGRCAKPGSGHFCNWNKPGRRRHPVNCVNWDQANQFARFKGARLPSESEHEYAATGGGQNQIYPWGNDKPTCGDKDGNNGNAVMFGNGRHGCGTGSTMPVCSKPAGNAKVSGGPLCDMSGNVWQWVQDEYRGTYAGTPTDGSAFEASGSLRVIRGGSFRREADGGLRAAYRGVSASDDSHGGIGFRLARSSP